MRFVAKSPQQVLAESRQLYREAVGSAPQSDIRNVDALEQLDALLRFEYRGVPFVAQPTPAKAGIWLARWQTRVQALQGRNDPEAVDEFESMCADAIKRFAQLARPARLRDRLRFWRRNPFVSATETEIGWLAGFFLRCRTIARVRSHRMN